MVDKQPLCDVGVDLAGAVIAVFLMAILYEGVKTLREYLVYRDWKHWNDHHKAKKHGRSGDLDSLDDDEDLDTVGSGRTTLIMNRQRHSLQRGANKG